MDHLLLQVDGVSRHDYSCAVAPGPQEGRRQVGQGLSGARACFDDQVPAVGKRLRDRKRHLYLPFSCLIPRESCRERPGG